MKSSFQNFHDFKFRKERRHICEICGSSFGRSGGLKRHFIMVHTNRKFYCNYSGCDHPGFKCSKALTAHIRSKHTFDRP
ncbi:unnamed protein product [Dracunculus medinensis]|uniref:C2H2-type domain-containing protein n=1 Tax=Dracunculus medinensis TaxID=318479 RepID=A0A0N4UMB4_DRAME|nr:unnamed protein product [Dracunculus medinensis]